MQAEDDDDLEVEVKVPRRLDGLARIALWDNIPEEMRAEPRWGIATLEVVDARTGQRDKAPRNYKTHHLLSPDSDDGWASFEDVIATAPPAIGYRLSDDDPFIVIDLDYRLCADEDTTRLFKGTLDIFNNSDGFPGTYVEYSQSTDMSNLNTASYHIVVKGESGDNRQRGPIQVFRRNHFIIMTGNLAAPYKVAQDNGVVNAFLSKLPPSRLERNRDMPIQPGPMVDRDDVIIQRMFEAGGVSSADANLSRGARAKQLFMTDSRTLSSSVDVSALEMELAHTIVTYTQNPQQFYRIFSGSSLYRGNQGGKSGYRSQSDYDDKYLMGYTFGTAMRAWHERQTRNEAYADAVDRIIESARQDYQQAQSDPRLLRNDAKLRPLPPLDVPPGLIGDMARFIYESSPRPLWESAVAGALSLMSTYVGRHYNINDAGLGLYILMVAGTGKGKETGPRGVTKLMTMVKDQIPIAEHFLLGSSLTSGAAAHNALSRPIDPDSMLVMPSKLLFWGEAGKTLHNLAKLDPSENLVTLKRFLLDVYSKGSWSSRIAAQVYSKVENKLPEVHAPNLVLLGDMTTAGLDTILTNDNILDGFVPRFCFVEYRGPRPSLQMDRETIAPPVDLVNRLCAIVSNVLRKNVDNLCSRIEFSPEARVKYEEFEAEVDALMDEMEVANDRPAGEREVWNRAGVKVLKVAGLLAVGCNHIAPRVEVEHLDWAIAFVRRDLQTMLDHISRSTSVMAHEERMSILMNLIETYFSADRETKLSYGAQDWQVSAHVVGYGTIVSMVSKSTAFLSNMESDATAPRTLDSALDIAMRGLTSRGFLIEERMARYENSHLLATTDSTRAELLYRLNETPSALVKRSIPITSAMDGPKSEVDES